MTSADSLQCTCCLAYLVDVGGYRFPEYPRKTPTDTGQVLGYAIHISILLLTDNGSISKNVIMSETFMMSLNNYVGFSYSNSNVLCKLLLTKSNYDSLNHFLQQCAPKFH